MRNVYAIRSHTLNNFEYVQKISWPLRIKQRTPTYVSVFETYTTYALHTPNIYQRTASDIQAWLLFLVLKCALWCGINKTR